MASSVSTCSGSGGTRNLKADHRRESGIVPAPLSRPIRYFSDSLGEQDDRQSGYAPACANEWRVGVCQKPRIKCGECNHRLLIPLSDAVIYDHLAGERTVGVYPLLTDDTCHFWRSRFSSRNRWRDDARAFISILAKNWASP